jgi:hypothetical protein
MEPGSLRVFALFAKWRASRSFAVEKKMERTGRGQAFPELNRPSISSLVRFPFDSVLSKYLNFANLSSNMLANYFDSVLLSATET